MILAAFGINHRSATIDFRERISFSKEQIVKAIKSLYQQGVTKETVIFSTCNRTEFYFSDLKSEDAFYEWLSKERGLSIDDIRNYSYFLHNSSVSEHLFRVASGLDSLALGEPQILGQVKEAYQLAKDEKGVKKQLNYLFQEAFHVAKNVRNSTKLGDNSISIAHTAIKLSDRFYSDYKPLTALVIGAGDTGKLVSKILHKKGISRLVIANRTLEKAQKIALDLGGYAINLEQIKDHIHEADIIVSATGKDGFLITKDAVSEVLDKRKKRMQLFLDLAVPRDIDPKINDLKDSYLYAVDDLADIVKNNQELRQQAAISAETLICDYNKQFLEWINLRKNNTLLKKLHESTKDEKEKLLKEAKKQINLGQDVDNVLELFATKLSKKLIHAPSILIRKACAENDKELIDTIIESYRFD